MYTDQLFERVRTVLPSSEGPPPGGERRAAAVLTPLFWDGSEVRVVLTKRTEDVATHKGQVSFPGGAREPSDPTLLATALRESSEEIGLEPCDVELLGVLGDLPTAGSRFQIRCFVGRVPADYAYVLDPREVERIITPPLQLFADPANRTTRTWERDGISYPVYFFDYGDDVVWGATARMLVVLCERLAGREPDPITIPMPPE